MPEKMNFELHESWISKKVYEAALQYVIDRDKLVHVKDDSAEHLVMYFVSKTQFFDDCELTAATDLAVSQFESTLLGEIPRGASGSNLKRVVRMSLGLAKVYVSPQPMAQVIECKANPLNLMCLGCPGFQGHGICSHVIAATHLYFARLPIPSEQKPYQFNLFYLQAKLYGKTGRRANHRPTLPPGGLHRDNDPSTTNQEDQISTLRHAWWGPPSRGSRP